MQLVLYGEEEVVGGNMCGMPPPICTWNMRVQSILSLLQNISTMKDLKQSQTLIIKTGLTNHSSLLTKLIFFSALSPFGSLQYAQALFHESPSKTPFVYNTMIRAFSQSTFPLKAIHLYNQMHALHVQSDSFTYTFVLKACGRLSSQTREMEQVKEEEEGKGMFGLFVGKKGGEIHCRVFKEGFYSDEFVQHSLIYMYGQCGLINFSRLVFDEMSHRSVVSWNAIIAAYDGVGDFESANALFRLSPVKNVVSWNTLLGRCVKVSDIVAAKKAFIEMPERDAISWNIMIACYVQNKDYKQALALFREMQNRGVAVTEITLISIVGACAEDGNLVIGKEIHEFLKQNGFKIEGYLGSGLVDMYAKCGNLSLARQVFNEMRMRHVSCWNSMIMGLAIHGYSEEALDLFSSMEKRYEEVVPNRITFIGVLIACSHKGWIEEGYCYFRLMINKYGIKPDMKHYGCMVDLLSRWGKLSEAYQFIKTMPFVGNSVLWRTLLGACRIYGNVELAEEAFQKIAELESPEDGDCVLLSNIYAELERWEDVERVRSIMINVGLSKRPGSSQIEAK